MYIFHKQPVAFLFTEPSLPVECPFHDAYMFSYNNNTGGFCRQPFSYVHACASEAKFLFSFKHCENAAYTYDQGNVTYILTTYSFI